MKTFLLYGSEACAVYKDGGIDALLSLDYNHNNIGTFGDIDIFDDEKIDIVRTLSNFSGWYDSMVITETEYNILFEYWFK